MTDLYQTVIDITTGETKQVLLTPEEIAVREADHEAFLEELSSTVDPVDKLKTFLASNLDVQALLNGK